MALPSNPPPHASRPGPIYWTVASSLLDDIRSGRYGVDDQLPTEAELQKRFSVSRHTVRQALRELQDQGYVYTQQGIGTRVRSPQPAFRFVHGSESIEDLLQFTRATEMRLRAQATVTADAALAARLQCEPGERWLELAMLRFARGEAQAIGFVRIYLRPEFAGVVPLIDQGSQPVFSLVEEHYGTTVAEMEQEIAPEQAGAQAAHALGIAADAPGLQVTRRYRDERGRLTQASVGFYPKDRFTHYTKVQVQRRPGRGL